MGDGASVMDGGGDFTRARACAAGSRRATVHSKRPLPCTKGRCRAEPVDVAGTCMSDAVGTEADLRVRV